MTMEWMWIFPIVAVMLPKLSIFGAMVWWAFTAKPPRNYITDPFTDEERAANKKRFANIPPRD